ncbi:MAG: universal stress protein [Acidimicrobiales bacterium]|nr:universal stress protein [Acidimicrobiales bacterium]
MSTDILVGIDGSENSESAFEWALDEAGFRGARVRAVLTWTYLGQSGSKLGPLATEVDAQNLLVEIVDRVAGDRAELVDAVTVNDLPAAGLLDQAASGVAMVVVGSRGLGGVKGLVLGSVSRTMVERSPVPVVVVPDRVKD